MAVEAATQPSKLRWGELEEDDGEDLDFLLPPKQVIGPDENGIKKVVEYKFNEEGNKVKITTTTRIRKLANARLSKRAVERRSWSKFGDAVHEDVGSRLTMVSTEEILLERPRAPGTKQEENKVAGDPLSQMGKGGAVLMVCRTCGKKGDHWTSRCPYKDLAQPSESFTDRPPSSETTAAATGATKGAYVPPSMRGGGAERVAGTDMRRRNEENSVRVTNLSEDTREPDLHELFRPFGNVSRVYVAIDQKTGMSRGFGFVNFVSREDAERAINKLNGGENIYFGDIISRVSSRRGARPPSPAIACNEIIPTSIFHRIKEKDVWSFTRISGGNSGIKKEQRPNRFAPRCKCL